MDFTLNFNILIAALTLLVFLWMIRKKLQGQWFATPQDRDGTLIMCVVFLIFGWLLFRYGDKFSLEAMAGYAMGLLNAITLMVAFHYKHKND